MNEIVVGDCIKASHSNGVLVITGSVSEILDNGYKINDFNVTGPEWTFEVSETPYPEVEDNEYSAEYARRRGWQVGTNLVGSPIIGQSGNVIDSEVSIVITSIADQLVLARQVLSDGMLSNEESYQFSSRKWYAVELPAESNPEEEVV